MIKYSQELLEKLVKESISFSQVAGKLGLSMHGGSASFVKKKILFYQIDTSHFLGQKANCGIHHKGGPAKKTAAEILIRTQPGLYKPFKTPQLRRAMLEYGFEHKCQVCKLENTWQQKPLVLHIDHVDGDVYNNIPENLRFLCPNCHSQTATYSRSKSSLQ